MWRRKEDEQIDNQSVFCASRGDDLPRVSGKFDCEWTVGLEPMETMVFGAGGLYAKALCGGFVL